MREMAVHAEEKKILIPDGKTVTEVDVASWETTLKNNPVSSTTGDALIVAAAKKHFDAMTDAKTDGVLTDRLGKALKAYETAKECEKESAIAALRAAFTAVTASYRAGVNYANALTKAMKKPVYDEREDLLRTYESYQEIMQDLQDEKSSLKTVGYEEITAELEQTLLTMNEKRLDAYAEARTDEWTILAQELTEEQTQYEDEMRAILSRGMTEWKSSARKLLAQQETWEARFQESFQTKEAAWDERYYAFIETKESWAKELTAQAVNVGDKAILNRMPCLTEDYIACARDFIISDVIEVPDADALIGEILDADLLSGLLAGVTTITRGIGEFTPTLFQTLKRDRFTTSETMNLVRDFQTGQDEELQARLAFIQYDKALQTLSEARGEVEESVTNANKSTWEGFRNMLLYDGFKETGDNFVKHTVVGATLLDNLYEDHAIKGYDYYEAEIPDFTKDFAMPENVKMEEVGMDGMQALLKKAMDAVPKEYERLFGKQDEDGNYLNATYTEQNMKADTYNLVNTTYDNATRLPVETLIEKTRYLPAAETVQKDTYDKYIKELESLSADAQGDYGNNRRIVVTDNGDFNEHVGFAPVMKPDADPGVDLEDWKENVRFEGAGQTNDIMGLFIQHKMIESAGHAAVNQPAYSRKLWDDRGSWMQAPTIRSLSDIAMSVAAACLAPGAANMVMNLALNMIDDAVFTVLDVSNGMDALDAFGGLAKKGLTSYVTSKMSGVFNGVAKVPGGPVTGGLANTLKIGNQAIGSTVIGSTLLKGAEIMTTNITSSAINAVNVKGLMTGGDAFDEDAFGNGAFGQGAMVGVMAGMAGKYVTARMGEMNIMTNKGNSLTGVSSAYNVNAMNVLNNTMGGLASTAVTYGMTGNASVNLINTSMLGLKGRGGTPVSVGLFELGFGDDGVHGAVSMSGTDMNLGNLAQCFTGYEESRRVFQMKHSTEENNTAFEAIAMFEHTKGAEGDDNYENYRLARELAGGTKRVALTDGVSKTGEGYLGMVDPDDSSVININRGMIGGGTLEDYAKLAAVMSHEGDHAYGEHVESAAYAFGGDSYFQMVQNLGLKGDEGFYKSIVSATNDPANKTVNGPGEEYWRVTKDENGKVVKVQDDGDRNTITIISVNGEKETVRRDDSMGLSQQIALINGNDSKAGVKAINDLMWKSGLDYKESRGGWYARNSEGMYTKTYLDYEYPGIEQKLNLEAQRKQEESVYRAEKEKENAIDSTSGLWGNLVQQDVSSIFMQDLGETAVLGNTNLPVYTNACHLVASIRGMNSLGKNISLLSAASDAANFDKNGRLMHTFFTSQGIDFIGPIQGEKSIYDTLEMLKSFDKPYALIGAAEFGEGYHSVSINQVYVAPSGNYEVECYETSSTGLSQGRKYGLSAANRKNYYPISKLYYMYKRN